MAYNNNVNTSVYQVMGRLSVVRNSMRLSE